MQTTIPFGNGCLTQLESPDEEDPELTDDDPVPPSHPPDEEEDVDPPDEDASPPDELELWPPDTAVPFWVAQLAVIARQLARRKRGGGVHRADVAGALGRDPEDDGAVLFAIVSGVLARLEARSSISGTREHAVYAAPSSGVNAGGAARK